MMVIVVTRATCKKKSIYQGLQFQRIRVHDHHGGEHENWRAGRKSAKAVAESSHLETQPQGDVVGRERETETETGGGVRLLKPQSLPSPPQ